MAEPTVPTGRKGALFFLVAIFGIGLVCGAALLFLGQRSIFRPHTGDPALGVHPLDRLERDLGLEPEQVQAIGNIMGEQGDRIHSLLEETRLAIRAVLTPEQQDRFDNLRPPRPGGPGPGGGHPGPPGPDGHRPPPRPPQHGNGQHPPPGPPPPPPDGGGGSPSGPPPE